MEKENTQFCVASTDLLTFQSDLNALLNDGWVMVPGTLFGFGMSHTMPPATSERESKKLLRYTQANFICVVEKK